MSVSRRHFLSTASLLISGAALTPVEALAATVRPRIYTKKVPLSEVDELILAWVKSFATKVRLNGVSVLGKLRGGKRLRTSILAEIPSVDDLNVALSGVLPFEATIYTSGNTVTFELKDTEFTIEALLPADFQAKLESLLTRLGVTFAADGITWNPDTLELSDPYGATITDLVKLIRPGRGLGALFDTLLEGLNQADEAHLALGASFKGFRQRVLNVAGRRSPAANEVARKLVGALPDLAENLPPGGVVALLASPLISGALAMALGLNIRQALSQFQVLRLLNAVDISDVAIHLITLIEDAIDFGSADTFSAGLDPFRRERFRKLLAEARTVTRAGLR